MAAVDMGLLIRLPGLHAAPPACEAVAQVLEQGRERPVEMETVAAATGYDASHDRGRIDWHEVAEHNIQRLPGYTLHVGTMQRA